jgi:hypothetical protein
VVVYNAVGFSYTHSAFFFVVVIVYLNLFFFVVIYLNPIEEYTLLPRCYATLDDLQCRWWPLSVFYGSVQVLLYAYAPWCVMLVIPLVVIVLDLVFLFSICSICSIIIIIIIFLNKKTII